MPPTGHRKPTARAQVRPQRQHRCARRPGLPPHRPPRGSNRKYGTEGFRLQNYSLLLRPKKTNSKQPKTHKAWHKAHDKSRHRHRRRLQTLSPQQIQMVKLLELPTVELEDRVRAELLENPALEEGRDESTDSDESLTDNEERKAEENLDEDGEGSADYDSLSDYLTEDDIPDYKLQENNRSREGQAERDTFLGHDLVLRDSEGATGRTRPHAQAARTGRVHHRLAGRRRAAAQAAGQHRRRAGHLRRRGSHAAGVGTGPARGAGLRPPPAWAHAACKSASSYRYDASWPTGARARTRACWRRSVPSSGTVTTTSPRKHWDKIRQKTEPDGGSLRPRRKGDNPRLNPRPGASMGEAIGRNMQQIVPDFIVETADDGSSERVAQQPQRPRAAHEPQLQGTAGPSTRATPQTRRRSRARPCPTSSRKWTRHKASSTP